MIYLDYNGSTPLDPQVAELVGDVAAKFANPSSVQHDAGREAAEIVEHARHRVAAFVGAQDRDVVFTSGASEAAAIAIVGTMLGAPRGRRSVVVSPTEHKAILAAAETGARLVGGEVKHTRVLPSGVVDLDDLRSQVDESTALVAVMAANNETGVLNPVAEVATIAHEAGALYFSDATQLAGKGDIAPTSAVSDLMVMSSHKLYGPKGAGALVADRHVQKQIVPIFAGGGQERGLRGGTHNTPALAGFGLASEIAGKEMDQDSARLGCITSDFFGTIDGQLEGVTLNGADAPRLSNTLNLCFHGADAEDIMTFMPNVAVSSGSACQSATPTHSHVLQAMGLSGDAAAQSIRISAGRPTTAEEIQVAQNQLVEAVGRARELGA